MLLISIIEVHLNTIYLLFGFLGLHVEALMPVSFLIFCDLHALPEFKKAVPGPFKIFRLDFFYGFLHLCDVFLVSYISHLVQFIIMFLSKQFGFISLLLHSHINATSIWLFLGHLLVMTLDIRLVFTLVQNEFCTLFHSIDNSFFSGSLNFFNTILLTFDNFLSFYDLTALVFH